MDTAHNYDVRVKWTGGSKGKMRSQAVETTIEVATPPQFPKGVQGIWSPEHLFVAAVNSCLMTTFLAIAENSKLEFAHFDSNASGKLEMVDGKYMITAVTLVPVVTILNEKDKERAEKIISHHHLAV